MISKSVRAILTSIAYIKNHPQILFALVLLIVIPLLFVYTGQQFLEVGKSNQDRILKDRIGLMHDTFAALLHGTNFSMETAQRELARVQKTNDDIIDYAVVEKVNNKLVYSVTQKQELLGTAVTDTSFFVNASLRTDESLIFEYFENGTRYWATYRAVESDTGNIYFIYTLFSLEHIDALFSSKETNAYFSLLFLYFFMIALAYWHIRLTDYRYLYIKAQKANEMKDLFTHMIAHELRSPLTAIRGYASLLTEQLASPKEREQSSRIKESADRLLAIVNDLLDVARLQSGKMSVTNEQIELSAIITNVLNELAITAREKQIILKAEGTDVSHTVTADTKRMYQALTNLLSNAIKYTPRGTITLSIEDKYAFIEIRVKDTGMGISSEDQKKLFAPFFRVAEPDVTKITGTGLGMWITKELIELMGGKIGVESIKNVGTHIVVTIPKAIRSH